MKTGKFALAALFGCFTVSSAALAADVHKEKAASQATATGDEARMKAWTASKEQLEDALGTGKDKAFYRQTLEKMGYAITAVNYDDPDYLEYEVIKGRDSYEVQVDFDKGVSDKVDVTANVWKAPATTAALKDKEYRYSYPATVTKDPERVSDRARGKAWAEEKTMVENKLGIGHERSYYRPALEKMGYKVTSVNDRAADNLELEVVKGDTSYEVEVEFDEKTKKSTAVEVSTNVWETEATERAKGEN
jgi:uncharacterized protein YmfQ (DUF2313 family)